MAKVDCLIVGAGPAGLTAAIYLARYRRTIALFDVGNSRACCISRRSQLSGAVGHAAIAATAIHNGLGLESAG